MLTGAAVNRAERFGMVIDGADALIVGHTHKSWESHPGKLKIDSHNNRITVKPFHVVNTSSWLNFGGYACRKLLLPSSHVSQEIILSGTSKKIQVVVGG